MEAVLEVENETGELLNATAPNGVSEIEYQSVIDKIINSFLSAKSVEDLDWIYSIDKDFIRYSDYDRIYKNACNSPILKGWNKSVCTIRDNCFATILT